MAKLTGWLGTCEVDVKGVQCSFVHSMKKPVQRGAENTEGAVSHYHFSSTWFLSFMLFGFFSSF